MYIPYGKQWIDEEDVHAVMEVLKSDFLTTGPKVAEFEKVVASYVDAKYAVAVSNGTAALHCACHAAGLETGDEVITTPMTFAASANCILYCGAKPVFADIDSKTYNIDIHDVERKITPKTKAIIAVDFTGQPCDYKEILNLARKHDLMVIEDASHSLGADYDGVKVGNICDMTTFSFHPVKHITSGEGGMVVTNDERLYQRLKLFRTHGITREPDLLKNDEGAWYYEQLELGYNYRISDIQCALGISQMRKLNKFVLRRRELAQRYHDAFKSINDIITPEQAKKCDSSWHLYVIQVRKGRKSIFNLLRQAGIGVNVHYIPVYKHPYYQRAGYDDVVCKSAELLYEKSISIPIFPSMTEEEQEYVINKVVNAVKTL